MKTKLDLSNISYNSPEWLEARLRQLQERKLIDYWVFIPHKAEMEKDNQANKKDHIHIMFRPAKTIQTLEIDKEFFELDPKNPDKPLRLTERWNVVQNNHFADWWLYVLHDPDYLKMKHLERQYRYSIDDVYCSDKDTLERLISFIDYGEVYREERITAAVAQGLSYTKARALGIFGNNPSRYANEYRAMLTDRFEQEISKQVQKSRELDQLISEYKARIENLGG